MLFVFHTESAEEDVLEVVVVVVVVIVVVVVVVVVVGKHSGGIGSPSSLKFHNIRRFSCIMTIAIFHYYLLKRSLSQHITAHLILTYFFTF